MLLSPCIQARTIWAWSFSCLNCITLCARESRLLLMMLMEEMLLAEQQWAETRQGKQRKFKVNKRDKNALHKAFAKSFAYVSFAALHTIRWAHDVNQWNEFRNDLRKPSNFTDDLFFATIDFQIPSWILELISKDSFFFFSFQWSYAFMR